MCGCVPCQPAWPHSLLCPGRPLPTPGAAIRYDRSLCLSCMEPPTGSFPTTAARVASSLPFWHGCRDGQHAMVAPWGQRSSTHRGTRPPSCGHTAREMQPSSVFVFKAKVTDGLLFDSTFVSTHQEELLEARDKPS